MSLVELQSQVKPITLIDMPVLKAKAEQNDIDKTKIFFERAFQQKIIPVLIRYIEQDGSLDKVGHYFYCANAFDDTRVSNTKEIPKYTKELFQAWTEYSGERTRVVFPDYDVLSYLNVVPRSSCWGFPVYRLAIILTRKDPGSKTT